RSRCLDKRDILVQIDVLLGRCHRQLGNTDLELASYQRALQADPLAVEALYWRALAQWRAGKLDDALNELKRVMESPRAAPFGWIMLSRLVILRNLLRPGSDPDWKQAERVLAIAQKTNPDAFEISILEAEKQRGQAVEKSPATHDFSQARRTLEEARKK